MDRSQTDSAYFLIFHMLLLTSELTGVGTGELGEEFYISPSQSRHSHHYPNSPSGAASGNIKNRQTRKSFSPCFYCS